MKHYKLMMASLLLAIGGGSAVAQTDEPVLKLQNVSNEAYNVTALNNFVVKADKYSLTVVGTIGQEITVRGDFGSKYVYYKYTPTSSTDVRFFRNNGKVYVYEGEDFKQELEEHVATANPIMVDGNVVDNDAQMLKDASFENHGKKYADNKYYLGSDWTTNTDFKSTNIRVTEDQNSVKDGKSKLLWRGTKCDRYFSQQISGLKPNTYYSIQLSQLDCSNANADFNIGFGTSAGDLSICATTVRLGKNTAKGKFVRLVKTPETIPSGDIYFTFSCTKDNTSNDPGQTDVFTQLDWLSVTEDKSSNEFLGISGVTAANYVENVVDEPNMVVVNAYKEKFKNCNKENPSDDVLINGSCDVENSGWVLSNMKYQQNKERPTRYVEKWVASDNNGRLSGKYSASQTVYDIPAGVYVLSGTLSAVNQGNKSLAITGASLNLNDKSVSVSGEWKDYSVTYVLKRDGELTASYVINNSNANWVAMDGLSLKYTQSYLDYLKEQYAVVKATATETLNNTDYAAVKGLEKTELANAINQNPEETKSALEAAINKLESAISAFTSAQPKYQALVDAKTLVQEELAYASKDKYTEFTTSKEATATSAADAETKANAIISARRAYIESNGMAEGVVGAEDYTSKVTNPNFTDGVNGWNQSQDKNGSAKDGETWTNVNGTKGGKYYDYWNGSANNQRVSQEVANLTPGKYIVTVKARAQQGFWMSLRINDNEKNATDINEIGNTGGVFDRGWNDYTAEFTVGANGKVKIEVGNYKPDGVDNKGGWFSFGDVRLVRLGNRDVTLDEATDNTFEAMDANVTLKRSFVANKWNTLVLPFAVSAEDVKAKFGNDAKVVEYSNAEDVNINFTTSTNGIKANVPVLIMPAAVNDENTYTFNSVSIVVADPNPKAEGTTYSFVGSYKPYNLVNDDYMLYADKWWKTETGDTYKIKAFRAYIKANTPAAAKQLNLVIDGQTTGLKLNTVNGNIEGETYNIAGQRVANSYKGLVIKNGKKIIKK